MSKRKADTLNTALSLLSCVVMIVQLPCVFAFAKPGFPGSSPKTQAFSNLVSEVHRQVNAFRREHGLEPLILNPVLSTQAREHSSEMARDGKTISHRGFKERVRNVQEKIPYRAAAENVATNYGYQDPARQAVQGWKKSPGHRKNMLGDYGLTGIGIAQSEKGAYFFTQMFIKPLE